MTTVITYGTFYEHVLRRARALHRLGVVKGDRVAMLVPNCPAFVVGCSTDEFNLLKGKQSAMPYDHRAGILRSIRYVDDVFPEDSWEQKREDIVRERARIFAMGDDWVGKFDDLGDICEVVYLPRTRDVSTTEIRQLLLTLQEERVLELRRALEHSLSLIRAL